MSIETKFNIGDQVYLVIPGKTKTTKLPDCPECSNTRKKEVFTGVRKDGSVPACPACKPQTYSIPRVFGDRPYTIYGISAKLWEDEGLKVTYYLVGSGDTFLEDQLFLDKEGAEVAVAEKKAEELARVSSACKEQERLVGVSYKGAYFNEKLDVVPDQKEA